MAAPVRRRSGFALLAHDGGVLRYRPIPLTRVGIDVIDGWLSKVDVTSPTGLRQLVDPTGTRPDPAVIAWLEERAGSGVG